MSIYTIVTDIHEDFVALKKVLSNTESKSKIICLGDIVGFCTPYNLNFKDTRSANSCISLLKEYSVESVIGNHDLNALKKLPNISKFNFPDSWYELLLSEKKIISNNSVHLFRNELESSLNTSAKDYLLNLEEYYVQDDILFSHYLYPNITGFSKLKNNKENFKNIISHFKFMIKLKTNISFIGHQHVSQLIVINEKGIKKIELNLEYQLDNRIYNLILCPPVVRYKGNGASHTVFNKEIFLIKWCKF